MKRNKKPLPLVLLENLLWIASGACLLLVVFEQFTKK